MSITEILFIIGEIFSLIAALCLARSTFGKTKKHIVKWQVTEQIFCIGANLSLGGYTGVAVNIVSLARNILAAKGKFSKKFIIPFSLVVIILGIIFNNRGWIGIIPIIATIEYTITLGIYKKAQNIRLAITVNLFLWAIYDFIIMAFPMFTMDLVIAALSLINYFRYRKTNNPLH